MSGLPWVRLGTVPEIGQGFASFRADEKLRTWEEGRVVSDLGVVTSLTVPGLANSCGEKTWTQSTIVTNTVIRSTRCGIDTNGRRKRIGSRIGSSVFAWPRSGRWPFSWSGAR